MNCNDEKIIWGISEIPDGSMKLFSGADNTDALHNRSAYFRKHGLDPDRVVSAEIFQGTNISVAESKDQGTIIPGVDGLISDEPGLIMTITVADCLPVYFFDSRRNIAGLAHIGWRGTELGMASRMIEKMSGEFSCSPDDIIVRIGPHIRNCHFAVGSDVAEKFSRYPLAFREEDGKVYLDLSLINIGQLKAAGVDEMNIFPSCECTYCQPRKYFSFRRDHPELIQAQIAYIAVR